jgi:hypothetical protein
MPVRLLELRRFDPPRPVEVEVAGRWWPGTQAALRLCDDGRGRRADVEYVVEHEWTGLARARRCRLSECG